MLLALDESVSGNVRISSAGCVSGFAFKDSDVLASKIGKMRANEIEVKYNITQCQVGTSIVRVKMSDAVFYPSATSEIWFQSKDFKDGGRDSMMRRMNAETQEMCLLGLGIDKKPSAFEFALELETKDSSDKTLNDFASWLIAKLPRHFSDLKLFGCCDVGGKEMFVRLETNVLMLEGIRVFAKTLPTDYPILGEKFDGLHPLMFGANHTCSALVRAIGNEARLISVEDGRDFAAIRIDSKCKIREARERAKDFLLPELNE